MTRVLFTISTTARRGAEVEGVMIAQALKDRGLSSSVVALAPGAGAQLPVPVLGRRPLGLATLRSYSKAMSEVDITVAYGSRTLPASALAMRNSRFIYRSIGDPGQWTNSPTRRFRTSLFMQRAVGAVALWQEAADHIQDRFGVTRVVVIPNARSADYFRPATQEERVASRRAFGLPLGAPVIACVGALAPEKRLETAIAAVALVADAQLVIAGAGPEIGRLAAEASRLLPGRHHFLGSLRDVRPVMAAADLVLLTSVTEGQPGALIEAGLSGLPVVASSVGGVPSVVDDGRTGHLVAAGDVEATANAVHAALASRDDLGSAARRRCEDLFDLEVLVRTWVGALIEFLQ